PAKVYTFSHKMPLSAMLKFSADIILLINNKMQVLDANENAISVLGISRQNLLGNQIRDISSPLIARLSIPEIFDEIQAKGEIQREFCITLDNLERHYRMRLIPTVFDNMEEGVTIIGEDITKQIQFAESLMISEMRYRAIVQDQTDIICRWRPGGEITFINESLSRFIGVPGDSLSGENILSYTHPDDIPQSKQKITCLTPSTPTISSDIRLLDKDGTYHWYQWNTRGIFDHAGALIECQSVGRDINTERQQAQQIRESEERFRMITDHSPFPISIVDDAGNFLYLNEKFSELFGYSLADIPTERDWYSLAFPELYEPMEVLPAQNDDAGYPLAREMSPCVRLVTCKDGTVRQINFFEATLNSGEKFVVYEDLTQKQEAKRLQSVLATIVNSSNNPIDLYRRLTSQSRPT
ncbi:MAG TPA: PAS domain S-box protein, partial [Methanoregula sp.]|nr:PAS domain S-box protein [Methanoregula sp.]